MPQDDRATLYLEDYVVGFEQHGGEYLITEAEILEFGRRFDPQPFHVDPVAAQNSHFGGLVAPGALTFSVRSALVNQLDKKPALIAGLGVDKLDLPTPARPGDRLSLRMRVVESRRSKSKPERGLVTLEYEVLNQSGDVVLSMLARMMVAARGSS